MFRWLNRGELLDVIENIKTYCNDSEILDEFMCYMSTEMLQDYIETFCRNYELTLDYETKQVKPND